jgi:hypothetical protein
MSTLRHRALGGNRFSGSVPSTISALTALTQLCVPEFLSMRRLPRCGGCASAWALPSVRPHPSLCVIRGLTNNNFIGPILASITALTRLVAMYAPFYRRATFRPTRACE